MCPRRSSSRVAPSAPKSRSLSPTAFAAVRARRSVSGSQASRDPPAAHLKNPWAPCTSRSPTRPAARSAARAIPASATASAGRPRRLRSIWCGGISYTQRSRSRARRADRVRMFVALDIPEEVRAALSALIARLCPVSRAARWTRIEGVHLTLKFIGEVQPEKVGAIKASLAQIRSPDSIKMKVRSVGFFPNERRPSVFWAGVKVGAEWGALASAVETPLEPLGIAKEKRAFSPHLTLARFKSPEASAFNRLHEAI